MKQGLVRAVLLGAFIAALAGQAEETSTLVRHASIWIDGNESFTWYNGVVRGTGSAEDPFVIEGWLFDGEESGIGVANTDAFFVIRACRFARVSKYDAISFSRVSNGRIEKCTVEGTSAGRCIGLDASSDCAIDQCDLTNSAQPAVIALWSCARITVTGSVLRSVPRWSSWCGVALWGTTSSLVSRNAISDCGAAIALNRDADRAADSVGNTLDSNSLSGSDGADVSIDETSARNLFFHNNLSKVSSDTSGRANAWDNGSEGNYWGHAGWDGNGDGISDTSHSIGNGDSDRHPLMRPWRNEIVLLGVKYSGADEWVTLRNWGQSELSLEGWRLESVEGTTGALNRSFSFPTGCAVPRDGTVTVHCTAVPEGKAEEGIGTPSATLWEAWQEAPGAREALPDAGGVLRLLDAEGKTVDEVKYGWETGN